MRIKLSTKDKARFEKYVDRSGGPDACHPWTGPKHRFGHGRLHVNGRTEYAHRIAWCLAGHEITEEKPHILHDCPGGDLPACCNDRHLWDGTNADNCRDKAKKGRGRKSKRGLPFGTSVNGRRFQARVRINGQMIHLGTHDTAEEANAIALSAKNERLSGPE